MPVSPYVVATRPNQWCRGHNLDSRSLGPLPSGQKRTVADCAVECDRRAADGCVGFSHSPLPGKECWLKSAGDGDAELHCNTCNETSDINRYTTYLRPDRAGCAEQPSMHSMPDTVPPGPPAVEVQEAPNPPFPRGELVIDNWDREADDAGTTVAPPTLELPPLDIPAAIPVDDSDQADPAFDPNDPEAVADLGIDYRLVRSNLGLTTRTSQAFRDAILDELECASGSPGRDGFTMRTREGTLVETESTEVHPATGCVTTHMVDRDSNDAVSLLWCRTPRNQPSTIQTCRPQFTAPRLNGKVVAVYDPTRGEAFMLSWTVPEAAVDLSSVVCAVGTPTTGNFSFTYRDAEGELGKIRFLAPAEQNETAPGSIERVVIGLAPNARNGIDEALRSRWDALGGNVRTPGMVHIIPPCPPIVYNGYRTVNFDNSYVDRFVCGTGVPGSDDLSFVGTLPGGGEPQTLTFSNPRTDPDTGCVTVNAGTSTSNPIVWCPALDGDVPNVAQCEVDEEVMPEDIDGEPIAELLRSRMVIKDPVTGGGYRLVEGTVNGIGEIRCAVGTPGTSNFALKDRDGGTLQFKIAGDAESGVQEIVRRAADQQKFRWQRVEASSAEDFEVPQCAPVVVPGNYEIVGYDADPNTICVIEGESPHSAVYTLRRTVGGTSHVLAATSDIKVAPNTGCVRRAFEVDGGTSTWQGWFCPTDADATTMQCAAAAPAENTDGPARTAPNPDASSSSETSAASDASGDDGVSPATIAGIAAGAAAAIIAVGVVIYCIRRDRDDASAQSGDTTELP